ncbi:hypothetical protein RJ55_08113 [Drechmeria coniospora]|nr:hypothetical protein RJ55_08113 [Drechmeria coniospora]
MFDPQSLVGSVIAVDSQATTYAIGCAPDTPSDECGAPSSYTVAQGPSTWSLGIKDDPASGNAIVTQDNLCKLDPEKDIAICTARLLRSLESDESESTILTTVTGYKSSMLPVTVTAGLDKLTPAPAASSTISNAASTTSSTATSTATSTTKGTVTSSTTTSGAAGPAATHNAILAGVAAGVAAAALL